MRTENIFIAPAASFVGLLVTVALLAAITVGCGDDPVPDDVPQTELSVHVEWTLDPSYDWHLGTSIAPGFIGTVEITPRQYAEHVAWLETRATQTSCDWSETLVVTPESRFLRVHLQRNLGPQDVGVARFHLEEIVGRRICRADGFRGGTMCVSATRIRNLT